MDDKDWGLTAKGFKCPTYVELLNAYEYKARELFGTKANLTVRSPLGIFLRIFAWVTSLLFQLIEDVYNSRFIDTAVGNSLYNLGRTIGLRLLPAQKAAGYVRFTGEVGYYIPEGYLVSTVSGLQYATVTYGRIGNDGTLLLPVQAVESGADYNVDAGTITTIVNPLDGITGCTNPAAVDGGRGRETDEEYRDRYYKSVDFAGGVNIDAIVAEINQNVEAVSSVIGYENDTDVTDELGLPPHSFEVVVYGGLDQDIAKAIYRRKAAGIQTHGSTTIPIISISGQSIGISFSRPTAVPIHIKITNLKTDPDHFADDGIQQITDALVAYIGDENSGGLSIGEDLIFISLYQIPLSVSGVIDFSLSASVDGADYGTKNIEIGIREKAVCKAEWIEIQLEGAEA